MQNLADLWTMVTVILVVLGIYFGTIETARAIFRRQEQNLKHQREAIDFGLANFDRLKDRRRDLLTRESLLVAKFGFSGEQQHYVEILIRQLDKWGHEVPRVEGSDHILMHAISRADLERVRPNI